MCRENAHICLLGNNVSGKNETKSSPFPKKLVTILFFLRSGGVRRSYSKTRNTSYDLRVASYELKA